MKIEIVYGVILCLTFIHVTISLPLQDEVNNEIELKALEFVNSAEEELQKLGTKGSDLAWAYNTNISDYNEEKQNEFKVKLKPAVTTYTKYLLKIPNTILYLISENL